MVFFLDLYLEFSSGICRKLSGAQTPSGQFAFVALGVPRRAYFLWLKGLAFGLWALGKCPATLSGLVAKKGPVLWGMGFRVFCLKG